MIVENPEEAIKGKRFADQNAESNAQLSWCRWIGSDGGGGGVRLRGHAVGVGLIEVRGEEDSHVREEKCVIIRAEGKR